MLQFLIPAIIILLAVIVITVIVIRHFPQAAAIDIENLPAEQEAAMKAALMERRLKRKMASVKNKGALVFRKIGRTFARTWKRLHKQVVELEQKYREKPHTMTAGKQAEVKQKIHNMLEQARQMQESENLSDAEAKYIEILSWDQKNLQAYWGLGKVYLAQREYKQAEETFSYLLRLINALEDGEDIISVFASELSESQVNEVYFDYIECLQKIDKNSRAMGLLKELLDRDPKNPKYLDKAVEISIAQKDQKAARNSLEALEDVNPENQKLASFKEQVRNL